MARLHTRQLLHIHVPVIMQPFTVPLGVSGFFATGGDFRGSLLQFFDLAVSALNILSVFQSLGAHSGGTRRDCDAVRGKPGTHPGAGPLALILSVCNRSRKGGLINYCR